MKDEEIRQVVAKKEAGKKLLEEVAASNAEQIELKRREKDKEVDEDRRVAAYLREREVREQQRMQSEEAIKAEKERETARLRAKQEKMKDKQAELDALRAKRAAEEVEQSSRAKKAAAAHEHMEELQAQILMNAE